MVVLLGVNNIDRLFFVFCPFQLLIPFVEDDSSKHEDHSAAQSRPATEERREILEVNKVLCSVLRLHNTVRVTGLTPSWP